MHRKKMLEYESAREHLTEFLAGSVRNNRLDRIANWVQTRFYDKKPVITQERKEAFFVAERDVLGGFLGRGKIEEFKKLLGVFDEFNQRTPQLKELEFKVLTDAIKDAQKFVVGNKECQEVISNIILTSFNDLRENQEFKDRFEEIDNLLHINSLGETTLVDVAGSSSAFVE
ncbi:hypothetical protein [Candidatus Tisiphia endosymbiont of Parasteatoda lunata]|uniref:hypothetical protein n=1 Tax=Candidatus Tisiphia endosymbiont of Parasteatoda lunata TaxID=3066275 RepID=UPI00313BFD76